ncbi:MAG: AAA family ATPase, partial [Eubacterium sp.]|nr:AAA family ATPase [Eubacterium sp.]
MIIRSLDLFNFRNYKKESFVFDPGTNILYGDNAQGKTNALEALFVGCTTKSHKGSKESELINKDSEEAH